MIEVDHVLWAGADLDRATAALTRATGFVPTPGGSHPGWGTRNALVGLGRTYLEVLSTDPAQDGGWLADEIVTLGRTTSFRWALRTDEMDAVVDRIRAAGLHADPVAMSRRTPDGQTLRWRIAFLDGHGLGRVVPFVIDWLDTPHPTSTLDAQGELVAVDLGHPDTDAVRAVLERLGVAAAVEEADEPWLRARLQCPDGPVALGGPE